MSRKKTRELKYPKELIEEAVKSSINLGQCLIKLGLIEGGANYQFLKNKIEKYNIDISHFENKEERYKRILKDRKIAKKYELKDLLKENINYNRTNLKKKLYKEGLKQPICELCGQDEIWNGMKISLILDHINGIRNDNKIENLRIVCPNCNAGLDTHCGKNKSKKWKNRKNKEIIKKEKINNIKQSIYYLDIDITKHGWGVKLSKLLNKTPQYSMKWFKNNFPELYIFCYKHKK